ncbi:molybdopterin-dependent oxidoreductase [Escherichia coli]|nr:molybdopterin-dependent oxidoreductase [Escherichia coli]ELM7741414.1 molybdopterin-dependent oxidoreductase [Escherichia coli]ELM7770013.1 molybdopterin-dependent oxidoreductase [Escherichia coli]ELM7789597.1 molybdopterin-dependent oxidoreductase [Escherichia coli]ELM7828578.1 molybdopterin-dependent oxidoreductase [Escherichia coli]
MKTKIPDAVLAAEVSRRGLVKTTAIGGLAMASSALTLPFSRIAHAVDSAIPTKSDEKVIWSACTVNCGSRCPLRMHVVDGEIKYVETDNTGDDNYDGLHQVRACLRGRSMRRRVYNPDRLKYPMKRVGARGEGKFERISWEEAYGIIATNMQRLIKEYGNESIYLNYGTGTLGGTMTRSWPPGNTLVARLMNCCGGYLNHYGDYSSAQIAEGLNYTYGGWADGNSPSDIENSKLVVLFGNNPGETRMSGGGVTYYLEQARQKSNARMIIIDPRYTDTGAGREDEWIPIRPGTDAALVNGLAYVMITENLVDQAFLDKYCVGYDEKTLPASAPKNGHYKAYILGEGPDGVAKTPEWASQITGVPADKIIKLAREIGSTKPAFISQGWGPQRHANGEILQDDKKCELIVVIDCHMTSSAKYADILLPDCTASEQMDFALDASCGNMSYVIFNDQVIKPRFECKTIYEMTSELAKRLGVEQQFTEGRTQEEWMRHLYAQSREAIPELPTFEEFRKQGIFKKRDPQGHHVAYKAFREDPQANPLTTPSGKIEIYSQALADIAATWELPEGDVIDPLPIYTPGFESYQDPLNKQYPLQLTGFHYKSRVHSTYGNVDVLKAACRQEMWINPLDAQKRGIHNGDKVRIFNDRGEVHIEAKVTPRMMPGVVALGEGAWYDPDAKRVDKGGCINVLTTQRPSPLAKGNPSHTNLVQVEKV